ncbi:hypothetical protein H5P33_06875 [Mycolicibacterium arabiense]|uniref:Ig-like domain-containing protein n=1 Tax=Mycolicibacterium arabiense TaxID=1286181 RepID=UPI0021F3AC90|nr:Ig-like domain-containing protein [Mycolicibacterium arabiense]MCV7372433.1 hypothetical protein [Mycolicibacterium arabiense]
MCANTPRHRAGDNSAQAGVWAARQILVNEGSTSGGRRHAVKPNTGYARYIGRVGALAVSLGVGMAVATSPGVAYAETESDPDSPAASGPSGAGPAASSTPASSTPTDSSPDAADVDEPAGPTSASESAADDGGDVPKMNVNSSGGAHTSTYGTSAAGDEDPVVTPGAADLDTVVESEAGQEDETAGPVEEPPAGTSPEPVAEVPTDTSEPIDAPADPVATDGDDSGSPTQPSGESAGGQSEGAQPGPEPSLPQTQTLSVTDDPAPPSESTFQATSFNTLIVPSPSADPLSALLAVPGAIVNVFTGFVGALLTPFLVPGPFAPAPLPGLWAVLAWVRREITHTFFNRSPIAVPIQTGQSLTGVVTGNLNAVDPNGDPLTATVTQQGQFGTVVINANGTYTYTPNGAVPAGGIIDSFKVTITDGPDMHLPGIFGLVQGVFECIARFVGIAQPDTIVKTVPVTVVGSAIGLPPVIVTNPVGPIVTPNSPPVVVDSSLVISDVDSPKLSSATVKVGVGYVQGDVLAYTPTAGRPITADWNATTGVLTLSGEATLAQYQEALRSVTFASAAATLVGAKAILISATDTKNLTSLPALVAVTMLGANVPPLVVTVPVGPIVTAGSPPVPLNPLLTVVDLNSSRLNGATVTITTGFTAGDVLALGPLTNNPVTGSWNAATGTLTLTGEATVAQYQEALRAVTFASTTAAVIGLRTVSIVATDDQSLASLPGLVAVTVLGLPGSAPSVIATVPVKLYTSGGTPVVLDANLTIVDVDSTTATGATVSFDPLTYDPAKDRLDFVGSGSITGAFNATTGVLALTGAGSIAEYQAALRSVRIASDAVVGLRTVTIVVTADGVPSAPGLIAVTIASLPVSTNLPSVIATVPVKLYTSGGTPVVLDGNLTIVDADSSSASGATVTIGGYTNGADTLGYNGSGPISGTFNAATGVLTLSGTASIAEYQAALRSVTFASTAGVGLKPVTIVLTADGVASAPGVVAVTVASLPVSTNLPSVIATVPVKLYTSGGVPAVLDGNLTIVDADSTSASGATVTIGGYTAGVDTLGYNGSGPISGTFDAATGVLTLTGSASIAEYQAALRSVTFASTAGVGLKPVTIVLTADGVASAPGVVAVTVASLPVSTNLPSVIATVPVKLYTSGGVPAVLDGNLTIVDADSTSASGATVTIGGYTAGVDTLGYNGSGPISGAFDAATGVLTLTGSASIAEYQAALRSVTFASTAGVGLKPVTIVLTADGVASAPGVVAVTVASLPVSTNLPSVIATVPVKLYTSGGTPVVLDANLMIVDIDSTSASGATVTIGGYTAGVDTLGFNGSGPISGAFDAATGVLTLSGTASIAEYQAALRSVTFSSTATVGVKPVTIVLTADGATSAPGLVTVTVATLPTSTNLPSVIATTPVKLYTSGGAPVVLDANVTIVDVDSTTASGATVTIGGYTNGADTLAYNGLGPISGAFDAATGILTLSGTASIAEYQAALRSVTFASTAGVGVKAVTIELTADGVESAPGLVTVTVATLPVSTNLPSVIATTPVKLYTSGGTPVVLDANLTIVDADSTSASGATVTIGGYSNGADTLSYNGFGPITGLFDPATGVLTLTGTASIAQYQAALRSVTFASTAEVGVKAVTIVLTADGVPSATGLVTVTVATLPVSTNLPSVVATTPVKLYTSGGMPVVLDANLTVVDADSTSASGATVTISGYSNGADTLGYNGSGLISGSFDVATGVLTLSGTASIAEYQAALRSVTFASTAGVGVKPVTIVLTADDVQSAPGLVTVTVATLPVSTNLPSVIATTPVKLYTSGGAPVVLDASLTIVDADSTSASGATVTIGGYTAGADSLTYNGAGTITGIFNPVTGVLELTGNATIDQYQAALRSVTFSSTATAGVKAVTIVLTADEVESTPGLVTVTVATLPVSTNVPSVVATSAVKLYTAGGAAVVLDPVLTVVDLDSNTVSCAVGGGDVGGEVVHRWWCCGGVGSGAHGGGSGFEYGVAGDGDRRWCWVRFGH